MVSKTALRSKDMRRVDFTESNDSRKPCVALYTVCRPYRSRDNAARRACYYR